MEHPGNLKFVAVGLIDLIDRLESRVGQAVAVVRPIKVSRSVDAGQIRTEPQSEDDEEDQRNAQAKGVGSEPLHPHGFISYRRGPRKDVQGPDPGASQSLREGRTVKAMTGSSAPT